MYILHGSQHLYLSLGVTKFSDNIRRSLREKFVHHGFTESIVPSKERPWIPSLVILLVLPCSRFASISPLLIKTSYWELISIKNETTTYFCLFWPFCPFFCCCCKWRENGRTTSTFWIGRSTNFQRFKNRVLFLKGISCGVFGTPDIFPYQWRN